MKIIEITFEDGRVYGVPLSFVAEHRAKYYAKIDEDTTYQEEYDYVMDDDYEGIDWIQNNMDWSDFAVKTFLIHRPEESEDYEELFRNAACDIVEAEA